MKFAKSIGIIGGAGPVASAFFYQTLLEECHKRYGSNFYNDFPEIILESYPFTRGDIDQIKKELILCIAKLQAAGAELLCLANNSFHAYLPDQMGPLFIHLIEETKKEIEELNIQNPLILGSTVTVELQLYDSPNFTCHYPGMEEQKEIMQFIREVAGGKVAEEQAETLKKILTKHQLNCDGVILACSELPIVHKKYPLSKKLPIIDSIAVLTKKILDSAFLK